MSDEKTGLQLAFDAIRKKHGKTALILSKDDFPEIERIPSHSLGLDWALNGGWPRGRIVEAYGSPSSGKTTCSLHAIAECQQQELTCALIDAESAFDPEYASALGVNVDDLIYSQPDNGEMALDVVELLVRSGEVALIVVDSVAALVPAKEIEGDMGDAQMGLQARLMSQAMRKLAVITSKTNTTIIFINQTRSNIGMYGGDTVSGGKALAFYASQRVDIRRIGSIKEGDIVVANRTRAKVTKNKLGPPFRAVEFNIIFGKGIDKYTEILEIAITHKIVKKSGAWFSYKDENIGQGKIKAAAFLEENKEICNEIVTTIKGLL